MHKDERSKEQRSDGDGGTVPTSGTKEDAGKLRYDLIPVRPLQEIVSVLTYGAAKYKDRNWEKGILWSRIYAATQRHLWDFWGGETHDPESGLSHLAHATFGCLALMEYHMTHTELDDRPYKEVIRNVPRRE